MSDVLTDEFEDLSPDAIHSSRNDYDRRVAAEKGEPVGDGLDDARYASVDSFAPWAEEELEADPMTDPDELIKTNQTPAAPSPQNTNTSEEDFTLQQPIADDPDEEPEGNVSAYAANSKPYAPADKPAGKSNVDAVDTDHPINTPKKKHRLSVSLRRGVGKYALLTLLVGGVGVGGAWAISELGLNPIGILTKGGEEPAAKNDIADKNMVVSAQSTAAPAANPIVKEKPSSPLTFGEENGFEPPRQTGQEASAAPVPTASTENVGNAAKIDPSMFYKDSAEPAATAPQPYSSEFAQTSTIPQTGEITEILGAQSRLEDSYESLTSRFDRLAQQQKTIVVRVDQAVEEIGDINARLRAVEIKIANSVNDRLNNARVTQKIVLPSNINLRRKPSLDSDVVEILTKGTEVTAIDSSPDGNWLLLDNEFWIAKWVAAPSPRSQRPAVTKPADSTSTTLGSNKADPIKPSTMAGATKPASSIVAKKPVETANAEARPAVDSLLYTISAIQPGTAWLRINGTGLLEVHEGDHLKGYGKILSIYQEKSDEWIIATEAGRLPVKQPKL